MNKRQAEARGRRDFEKHGQSANCPFKPGWQRGYWLRGYMRAVRESIGEYREARVKNPHALYNANARGPERLNHE